MKCHYCQGDLKQGAVPYHIDRNGYHLLFDKVPALVCTQCGEPYFNEHEVNEIQNTIRILDERIECVTASTDEG
jgi:YgiT-type zinc finger domain-containing protein